MHAKKALTPPSHARDPQKTRPKKIPEGNASSAFQGSFGIFQVGLKARGTAPKSWGILSDFGPYLGAIPDPGAFDRMVPPDFCPTEKKGNSHRNESDTSPSVEGV
jgi:hypothetical protein